MRTCTYIYTIHIYVYVYTHEISDTVDFASCVLPLSDEFFQTHVILGDCELRCCCHFRGILGVRAGHRTETERIPHGLILCARITSIHFWPICSELTQCFRKNQEDSPWQPRMPQRRPGAFQREPKEAQGAPRGAKGNQKTPGRNQRTIILYIYIYI